MGGRLWGSQVLPVIHSFNKYVLDSYYVLGTVPHPGDSGAVKSPRPCMVEELTLRWEAWPVICAQRRVISRHLGSESSTSFLEYYR